MSVASRLFLNNMELYGIFGGTKEDLESRAYNIGVGISLGNKWFTIENTLGLIKWALKYTRKEVIIYVADSIHAINLEVRREWTKEKAIAIADQMGTDFLSAVKDEVNKTFTNSDAKRIRCVKWNQLDPSNLEKVAYVYSYAESHRDFRNQIESIVREFTSKEQRKFNDVEIKRLGDYLIEELPEQICRINMDGEECDAFAYPYSSSVTAFFEDIKQGKIFPEIRENIMDTEPKVFLEVR